jgi:hypothetical protein
MKDTGVLATPDDPKEETADDGALIGMAEEATNSFFRGVGHCTRHNLTDSFEAARTCELSQGSHVLYRIEKTNLSGSALVVIN